ncbi:MAG: WD40 repeat domain-containing protein [Chitinophagales bacterium]|nr:WD40 repeat domain-containing protein [Sphingobacteriales bacterium]MCC7056483.1 WD40 repeat domain-containing protein [Chitinophagales bacterium]HMS51784.1 WD40 repeat domain-containing protein [Chitinophagales bacterium]
MEHKTSDGKVHKIETLAFSPDAKWLATAGEGNDILIWDLGKNTLERTLKGHSQYINHVVFNQTGDKLASASDDGYVILWHVSTGQILKKIENAPPGNKYKGANFVLFDPTEQYLYFGGKNFRLNKCPVQGNSQPEEVFADLYILTTAAWTPDKKYLAIGCGKHIRFFDPVTKRTAFQITPNEDYVNDLCFSHDGSKLAAWSENGQLHLWEYPSRQPIFSQMAGDKGYSHILFSLDDKFLISGNSGTSYKIWDIETQELALQEKSHQQAVANFAFNNKSGQLYVAGSDGQLKSYNLSNKPFNIPAQPPTNTTSTPATTINRAITDKATIVFNNSTIQVEIWDDEKIDGDIVSLFFNDECVLKEYAIQKDKKAITLHLPEEQPCKLVLYAHNLGKTPPNTAALNVTDGKISRQIKLSSDMKKSEAIKLLYRAK